MHQLGELKREVLLEEAEEVIAGRTAYDTNSG